MTVLLSPVDLTTTGAAGSRTSAPAGPSGRSTRREIRRRTVALRRVEDRAVRRANLLLVAALLGQAETIVSRGWIQHGWFAYDGPDGRRRVLTAHGAAALGDRPVAAACLVGAIVAAGGGPRSATAPAVGRALEVVWLTGRGRPVDPEEELDWSPAPPVHSARVRDLTRWNDEPARTAGEVRTLLATARSRAETASDPVSTGVRPWPAANVGTSRG